MGVAWYSEVILIHNKINVDDFVKSICGQDEGDCVTETFRKMDQQSRRVLETVNWQETD